MRRVLTGQCDAAIIQLPAGKPDMFQRFVVPDEGRPLAELGWRADEDILVVERGGLRLALIARQMTYHHVAQGMLAGEPYLVSF